MTFAIHVPAASPIKNAMTQLKNGILISGIIQPPAHPVATDNPSVRTTPIVPGVLTAVFTVPIHDLQRNPTGH
jgi:hypothetical protein